VYNPPGAFLAPQQSLLETEYKRTLAQLYGISFTYLYTITNLPIGRFRDFLVRTGNLDKYMETLITAFNPMTLDSIMCRHVVNVDWNGKLYDCDFNQALGITITSDASDSLRNYDYQTLVHRKVAVDDHCYGCTAGQGSTCVGAAV
jgi:radical SAM/Cys-rich protein